MKNQGLYLACLTCFVALLFTFTSCNNSDKVQEQSFHGDKKAIDLADRVMEAMGGEEKWNNLRFVSWNFFGVRDLFWDKYTGRVRIENESKEMIYLVNVNTVEGSAQINGEVVTDTNKLSDHLASAKNIWINDSYWWTMPFKLKDPGVNLAYLRIDTLPDGRPAEVLQLTFNDVGTTPENKYEVYIDTSDYLIKQWAFFKNAESTEADFVFPWDNYKSHDGLLLSDDRSNSKGPFRIRVYGNLPDSVFESF